MANPTNLLRHRRRIGSMPYNGGGRQAIPIDLVGPCTGLNLRLRYTIATGATAPIGVLFQQNARIAKRIEVIAQGRDTVLSVSGQYLAARHQYENFGAPMKGMETAINQAANQTTNVDVVISVRFDLPRGRRTDDAALDLRGLTQCQLAFTWGSLIDLFTTPGATVAISNQQLDIEAEYLLNVDPKAVYATRALDEISVPLQATNNNFAVEVDARTGLAVRSLAIFTETGAIGDASILAAGSIRLEAGAFSFMNTQTPLLLADVRRDLDLLPGQEITGMNFLELLYEGQLASAIPTGQLDANLKLFFDATYTAGASLITIQREVVRPLKIS